ncbi:scoloptoxin SSD14-like [Aphidius gifuensis]|uniref:scoloptoxin SSD14-like n=1 Tax=Aphidius gifuensis TaxID=684658 RepID=UPI001CDCC7C9|nr:scoloptoxin SSD14-like [Aphidius gifuensis]
MICNGLINMQWMGMGGGFLMTIYERSTKQGYFLNARDVAPYAAHAGMFENVKLNASIKNGLSIAVPGEIAGYWAAHQKFGKIPWDELFNPTIKICEEGWNITKKLANAVKFLENVVRNDPTLRKMFVNNTTGAIKKEGDYVKPDKICQTLLEISKNGPDIFYNGEIGRKIIEDVQKNGSTMMMDDLKKYQVKWSKPVTTNFLNMTLYTSNFPGSGGLFAFILNVFDEFKFTPDSLKGWNNTIQTYHRIIETWKYAYAVRSKMGDADYVDMTEVLGNLTSKEFAKSIRQKIIDDKTWNDPAHYGAGSGLLEDHGTSHISVLAPNGDAVAVTSTINTYFGSGIVSEQTGIILNNAMDDFSIDSVASMSNNLANNKNNNIKGGKRPLSSMIPSIITSSNGDVRIVLGGAGGTRIPTSVSLVLARYLWMDVDLEKAVDACRIHQQLFPVTSSYEYGINSAIVDGLQKFGHSLRPSSYPVFSGVYVISKINDTIYGSVDDRKGGDITGL